MGDTAKLLEKFLVKEELSTVKMQWMLMILRSNLLHSYKMMERYQVQQETCFGRAQTKASTV